MIKIEKNLNNVPASLQVPPMNNSARVTHRIRERVIQLGRYPKKSSAVDKRYKMEDIKAELLKIYHGKCAFCEQRVERGQVEHFHPKSIFYWLAFSWSNLLYACPTCNGGKSNHFEIIGHRVSLPPTDLTQINSVSATYNTNELPKFINPDLEDPSSKLIFQQDGLVSSTDSRMEYTLEKCQVHRKYLNDRRKEVWDDFITHLQIEVLAGRSKHEIESDIKTIVRQFIREA